MQNNDSALNVAVTFRHTEPTAALKTYAIEKVSAVFAKYSLGTGIDVEVILSVEKRSHSVEVFVKSIGYNLTANATTEDLYSAIDKVIDALDSQLRKQKDRNVTQKHHAE